MAPEHSTVAPARAAAAPWLTPEAIAAAGCILSSHQRAFTGPTITSPAEPGLLAPIGPDATGLQRAQALFASACVVVAHDGSPLDQDEGPRLIYANRAALGLWLRPWSEMVGLPSKFTAAPAARHRRQQALEAAQQQGTITGYSGIRIDSQGRQFQITGARLWTLRNSQGEPCGQAASFSSWWWL